jgi:hypothetical protein
MTPLQSIRGRLSGFAGRIGGIRDWSAGLFGRSSRVALVFKITVGGLAVCFVAFWVVFFLQYSIDDDPNLAPDPAFAGGSAAVAMAATLMDQEIHHSIWAPNKPWFYPIAHSTNMTNYQRGVQYAVARWAVEMSDLLGRERGSGEADRDLITASGRFKFDPSAFLLPSAVTQYKEGIASLVAYNQRLAAGQAKYDKIASNLSLFIDRISKDLGSQSATIELMVLTPSDLTDAEKSHLSDMQRSVLEANGGYFDRRATETFFATKGRMYAYLMLLKAIGEDYHDVLVEKNALFHWENMLLSLRSGATLHKFFIANGEPGSYLVPSDIAVQGFFLLRADKQLKELADILNK